MFTVIISVLSNKNHIFVSASHQPHLSMKLSKFLSVSFVAAMVVKTCTHNAKFFIPKYVSGDFEPLKFFDKRAGANSNTLSIGSCGRSKPWFEVKGQSYNSKRTL